MRVYGKLGIRWNHEDRVEAKRNSFEGFLTRIVAMILKERIKEDKSDLKIEFSDIWVKIKLELEAQESPSRPNCLETNVYGVLTKQKIGR